MDNDAELLGRYVDTGSGHDFGELVRKHLDFVYGVALRKVSGDARLAEDVAQRVFTDLARKAGMLRRHPALAGWLFTAAHYTATLLVRAEERRRRREQRAHAMNEPSQEPAPVDWESLRPALDDVINEWSDGERHAVVLSFIRDDLSPRPAR